MDPIRRINELVALLRSGSSPDKSAQLSTKQPATSASSTQSLSSKRAKTDRTDISELKKRVLDRIALLTPDQRKGEKAVRIFIESVLAWEFGSELQNDPRLHTIAQEISEHFIKDHSLQKSIQLFLRET
ncbi:MAG: hypothetical protein KZQ97_05330 [Candidatus Thiodiazotropha sp. (ex Dulcina madagascariensis)]|nr:hypothetical protein [Candidatus Thiodiazotropha sp. (ex Dulcina madagascariensis)]